MLPKKRKTMRSRPPRITSSGIENSKKDRFAPWLPAEATPNEDEKKLMIAEALKIVLTTIMKNHVYIFNKELRIQKEGGPIGIDLTGELAQIFMSWWDRTLIQKMHDLNWNLMLYERYVDDIAICVNSTEPGIVYKDNEVIMDENLRENEKHIPEDQRTFTIIKYIGENIHESIKLETDVPSNHDDQKLPLLDLKVYITHEEIENDENIGTTTKIYHEYYMKEVSCKLVIHRNSALSISNKRTILTQMCLRIVLNCSSDLPWIVAAGHLTNFMLRMQISGYDAGFRYEILMSAMKAYEIIKFEDQQGIKPMYRSKNWNKIERREEKEKKRKTWYTKGGYETVLFVPATPNSQLKNNMQKYINNTDIKIKVVEKSGIKLIRLLQKNDPFKSKKCEKPDCLVCAFGEGGSCRSTSVSYKISCKNNDCEYEYTGQTGLNGYTRGLKHKEEYRAKRSKSTMWKHVTQVHNGIDQSFEMEIIDKCRNDPTKRQILESIRINKMNTETTMNDRSEWNIIRIPRINIDFNN